MARKGSCSGGADWARETPTSVFISSQRGNTSWRSLTKTRDARNKREQEKLKVPVDSGEESKQGPRTNRINTVLAFSRLR